MTVVCVRAESLVAILALLQFNSAGFSDKEEIIAPVITVWERFSVAKNQQMSKHPYPWSLQPVSCSSYALNWEPCGQLIKGFNMWSYSVCMSVLGHARESFLRMSTKKYNSSLCCSLSLAVFHSRLCSLSPSPHHLSVSHHCEGRKPWRASQPDLFNVPTDRPTLWGVRLCVYAHTCERMNQSNKERRREMTLDGDHLWHSIFDMRPGRRRGEAGWGP